MLTIVVTGRNDEYGGGFLDRLLRTARANADALRARAIRFEYLLVEWNPVAGRALAAERLVRELEEATAIVVGPDLHAVYSLNPAMVFHEMAAKNVGIRHARGATVVVTNADVIFGHDVIDWLASANLHAGTLYRASRVDVVPDCPLAELADRRHQLASGEGILPTCGYLGAGGDFCAARRELWHALGGFDERTRFTTRAKDWQFFLSARSQKVAVEYVGAVYHLDHGEGFRNTPGALRDSASAHFGGSWDFEFHVPIRPPDQWGLADARLRDDCALPRVRHVEAPDAAVRWRAARERDAQVWTWLRAPRPPSTKASPALLDDNPAEARCCSDSDLERGLHDFTRAVLMHVIVAAATAGRPLVIEPRRPRAAVAAWGLARIAREQQVDVRVRWSWPEWCDVPARALIGAPVASGVQAWTATIDDEGRVHLHDERKRKLDVLPRRLRPATPSFDPLLARRLLRAWLRMLAAGWRRIAIYGAGSHTRSLLRMGAPDWLDIAAIVVSRPPAAQMNGAADAIPRIELAGIPVRHIGELARDDVDGVLLSSITYEADMRATARSYHLPALPLYADDADGPQGIERPHTEGAA